MVPVMALLVIQAVVGLLVSQTMAPAAPATPCRGIVAERGVPDTTARIFLPGLVSGPAQEFGLTLTEDWTEIYFTRLDGSRSTIMMLRCAAQGLQRPVAAPFSGSHIDGHPSLLPGGRRLVFSSRRPSAGARQGLNPWIVERTDSGWGAPRPFGRPVTDQTVHAPSVSSSGTIYASGIIRLRATGAGYLPAEALSPAIDGYGPAIAADESYLVYSAGRRGGFGGMDLYVVFAGSDGRWGEPRNLGRGVNSEHSESSPTLSLDGRYLFFSRHEDIWWVGTEVIEKLRP